LHFIRPATMLVWYSWALRTATRSLTTDSSLSRVPSLLHTSSSMCADNRKRHGHWTWHQSISTTMCDRTSP